MEFSKQENWSGLSFPSPEDLPNPGIKPRPPKLQADSLPSEPPGKVKVKLLSPVQLFATAMDCSLPGSSIHLWDFPGEYWSGLVYPSPGGSF